ncbi:LacI family DNA-binding transcriptional regulator [Devriesea agamarum]|uniref:LacI family DNA-binding transcriptional regulator n=1 Tax=Devriesea agamarum TaxID=472569 RepID=UPI00071E3D5D|nr:LacI family DNA-binding transcriptional regulator [Devriesea agamarum]
MKARLIDIARQAQVSEATVSRVLNGKPGVEDDTRARVLDIAARLGRDLGPALRPVEPAVGIVVPDLENPVFPQFVEKIEAELFSRGIGSLVGTRSRSADRERIALERLYGAGVRGVVMISGHHANATSDVGHYRELTAQGMKFAFINGVCEKVSGTFISTDDALATRMAVDHLEALGHRTIGLAVGDVHTYPVRQKTRAFQDLIDQNSSSARKIAYTDFSHAGGFQAAIELLSHGCTAMVCGSDVMARGAVEGVCSRGLTVPGDVSVVGYDDIPSSRFSYPTLTSVRQPLAALARAAVDAVVQQKQGSRRPVRSEIVMQPELVVRGSTGAAPKHPVHES